MYPRKLAKEVVMLLISAHSRGWHLISSTLCFRDDILIYCFQNNQKIWNSFKYSLHQIEALCQEQGNWTRLLDFGRRGDPSLCVQLLGYKGVQDLFQLQDDHPQPTDEFDIMRFTTQALSIKAYEDARCIDTQLSLGLDGS